EGRVYELARIIDRNENMIGLEWDDERRMRVRCSGGQRLDLSFDPQGRLTDVVEHRANLKGEGDERIVLAQYAYDSSGQLREVIDRAGATVRQFDWRAGLMVFHRHGEFEASYQYEGTDASARVVKHWNNVGQSWTFSYEDRATNVTDQD